MKKFINRQEELGFLEKEYKRDGSSLVILYGRRRVGKTALTNKFIENKKAIYFLATEENETQNRIAFKNVVAEQMGNELLMNANVDSWDMIFKVWIDADAASDGKKLMIIDEFQYLGKANRAFPSVFQRIWDTILKDRNVMVILCGSLISMMESQTLAYSSPLYGRRTGQIKLKQIAFRHYHEFFPDKSEKELIEYYAITGGVPKYIELFYDSANVYSAIENNVLSKSSFLYDEPNFLLQREVSEVGSYFSIIKTIASGNQKLSKIATALELKQTGLTKYLKTLINLDILEREVPVTEDNPENSKKGLYKIKDNFMLFWFRFIFPNLNYIESGHVELAMNKIRANLVDAHIAYVYENVCIEKMWELNASDTWDFHFDKVGRWWNNNTEIDIVALDKEGNHIIFGECKYWTHKVGVDVLRSLEKKAEQVEWKRNERKDCFILFSINGFTDELMEFSKVRKDLILMS
ncbi:MAG: ATP-binding protein [Lachnospiraceae bacterium]|nr:ATP-binding protein [Lachnospiraceae bacterium]